LLKKEGYIAIQSIELYGAAERLGRWHGRGLWLGFYSHTEGQKAALAGMPRFQDKGAQKRDNALRLSDRLAGFSF
jgi:hypothetical protein